MIDLVLDNPLCENTYCLSNRNLTSDHFYRESGYVNQIAIQADILEQLIQYVRAGFPNSAIKTNPKKIVLLGHSLGSVITNALVAAKPTIADGVILTGWGFNTGLSNPFGLFLAAWDPKIANNFNPARYHRYDNGYIIYQDYTAYIIM